MSKTKIYNPFSDTLMNLIKGVYSSDEAVANKSFDILVQYFKTGLATAREVHCLIMTNQNYIVKLLSDISDQPGPYELLRSTIGRVVAENLSVSHEDDVDITGDDTVELSQ